MYAVRQWRFRSPNKVKVKGEHRYRFTLDPQKIKPAAAQRLPNLFANSPLFLKSMLVKSEPDDLVLVVDSPKPLQPEFLAWLSSKREHLPPRPPASLVKRLMEVRA